MTAWAILTLALAVGMMSCDKGRQFFEDEVDRCYGDPTVFAFALLAVSAGLTAPVALVWLAVKAVVLAVVR